MSENAFENEHVAAVYDAFEGDRPDLEVYLSIAEELGAQHVLDVGCGTGTFALLLAERGIDVVAIDPARAMLDVARAKPCADRVRWIEGDASALPPLNVDLATMTGNVAQAIVSDEDWSRTLRALRDSLRPGGWLVFETRDPAREAWREWNRDATHTVLDVAGIGPVESWDEVVEARGALITFTSTSVFPSGETVTSRSTLRFRDRAEVEADLAAHGYVVEDVRDAPDRPGRELVFFARPRERRR